MWSHRGFPLILYYNLRALFTHGSERASRSRACERNRQIKKEYIFFLIILFHANISTNSVTCNKTSCISGI